MLTFFTPFDVKMIQISTFPAAPSTERVPSLAERVASLRYSINLQLLNNRVPGLVFTRLFHISKWQHNRRLVFMSNMQLSAQKLLGSF